MSRRIILWCALIVVSASMMVQAQDSSAELSRINDSFIHSVQEQFPEWTYKAVPPIEGSRDVSISQWTSGKKMVSVTIVGHASREEAVKRIRELAAEMKAEAQTPEAGEEEEYSWNTSASIVFRKGRLTIHVNVRGDDVKDEKKLSKQFARLVADAISAR